MVYRDDAKILSGITDGDKMGELPNATWISLAPEKADVAIPPAAEEGESRIKKILRTAGKVGIVAVAGVGLVAFGALAIMAASASPDFGPPEEGEKKDKEKMMKRPGEVGDIPRRDFEGNARGYFREHRERKKAARALR